MTTTARRSVGPFTDAVQAGAEAAFYGERDILTARFVRRPQFDA